MANEATVDYTRGIQRIAKEREEQIAKHGYGPEHDDEHQYGEMLQAAGAILSPSRVTWPWNDSEGCNLQKIIRKTRIEQLAIAGALIAAEIDRQLRLEDAQRKPE